MKSPGIWILTAILALVIAGFTLLFQPISRTKDTPLMRAYDRLYQTGAKLKYYADEHSTFPDGMPTAPQVAIRWFSD